MIKAIIIDDEEFAREVLKEYLEDFHEIELIGEFHDGFSGLKAINELKPDLVFLDIQMPKLTGFEILEVLDENPMIIFTTAYDQFALQAFEQNAIDYLLKPFSKERFRSAVEKALSKEKDNISGSSLDKLSESIDRGEDMLNRVVIKIRGEIRIVGVNQIIYIEAQDDYVMIYLEKEKFLKQKTMSFFEKHLDPGAFIRVHRSYIVKIDHILKIEAYEKHSSIIILKDGRTVPVSRNGLMKLKRVLGL